MKKTFFIAAFLLAALGISAQEVVQRIVSPDQKTWVDVCLDNGHAFYQAGIVDERGQEIQMVDRSALGLHTDLGNWAENLTLKDKKTETVSDSYNLTRSKQSHVEYRANAATVTFQTAKKHQFSVRFEVSDNNIAFRYEIPTLGETLCLLIEGEATCFNFPKQTTTFICPQSDPQVGWKRSKPSYEEEYAADAPMTERSKYGRGYTFPCLFHEGDNGWLLVSETGTTGKYCGCRLSDYDASKGYQIAFPMQEENNRFGTANVQLGLPGETPWRTITLGATLKPIVETTVPFDVVRPLYSPSKEYMPGRSTWSWIVWQDASMNYKDQITFAELAAKMGWEYILVDALWDTQVGDHKKMEQMFREIQQKGVDIFLWYNSNGGWNDAPQGARHCMDNSIARKAEMKWLRDNGIKGIKVDFFGGDKQETMRLYEAILSDANDYGIQVIFHGCTLPRGWERMYPNYCASEAVLASENMVFQQHFCDMEAFNACLHPFIRNAVGSMDFGGTFLQQRLSRDGKRGSQRRTTDMFEIATAVAFQSSVQNFAITPMSLETQPQWQIDAMRQMPTTWDETRFIDGYPGKYIIMARRNGEKWYVAALNGEKTERKLDFTFPEFANSTVTALTDRDGQKDLKVKKDGRIRLTLPSEGGALLISR